MKQLILIRHAKAEDAQRSRKPDRERALTERGSSDALRMALWLAEHIPHVDAIVTSPARRTLETAHVVASVWHSVPPPIIEEPTLYMPSLEEILTVVKTLDSQWKRVVLVGHNPSISELRDALLGLTGEPMPTCAVAVLDLPCSEWRDTGRVRGVLTLSQNPKTLP